MSVEPLGQVIDEADAPPSAADVTRAVEAMEAAVLKEIEKGRRR
jgi:hypothetical protein